MSAQRGGIVLGWLMRLVIGLVLLGVVAFEAGAVIVAKVSVDSTAEAAGLEAASEYARSRDPATARVEAERKAKQGGARVTDFSISGDGQFVTVTCVKIARTIFIQKLGSLRNHRVARATHRVKVT